MKPKDISSTLTALLPKRRPILVSGPPGCGKTEIVRQTAENLGAELLISHPVTEDPTDPKGLPWFADGKAEFIPFGTLRRAMEASGPTVWFLDDLGQATAAVQGAYMQLLLERRVNGHVLAENVYMVAASNRHEDRAGCNKMITPLLNRFLHIDIEVSEEDWQAWALTAAIDPIVRAFIRFKPGLLFQFDPTAGARSFPTPRSWDFVSQVLGATPEHLMHPVVSGCVGEGPAAEFVAFRRLYTQLPDPMSIIANPQGAVVPQEPSVVHALSGALTERAKTLQDPQLNSLGIFAARLSDEYACLLFRDCIAVNPRMLTQKSAKDWVAAHADLFCQRA